MTGSAQRYLVLHYAQSVLGGVGSYIEELSEAQCKHMEKMIFLLPEDHSLKLNIESKEIITFKGGRGILSIVDAYLKLSNAIKNYKPDILHLHSSYAGLIGRLPRINASSRVKVIYCAHGWAIAREQSNITKTIIKYIERILSYKTNAIYSISSSDFRDSISIGICSNKNHLILNGIKDPGISHNKEEARNKLGWKKENINLLFVGRLDRQKGYDLLIKGITRVAREDLILHVVGKEYLNKYVENGPADSVVRYGWVDREKLDLFYSAADALIVPSRWEGFGLVAVEAMARGTPVLHSGKGGLQEVVGDQGMQFDIDDEQELETLLSNLSRDHLEEFAPRDRFLEMFNIEVMNNQIINLYMRTINED